MHFWHDAAMLFLAACLSEAGNYRQSADVAEQSLDIFRQRLPADHYTVAAG